MPERCASLGWIVTAAVSLVSSNRHGASNKKEIWLGDSMTELISARGGGGRKNEERGEILKIWQAENFLRLPICCDEFPLHVMGLLRPARALPIGFRCAPVWLEQKPQGQLRRARSAYLIQRI
jgi:hypothetical protein